MQVLLSRAVGMLTLLSFVAGAQTLQSTTTLTSPTILKITTVTTSTTDITSAMATLTAPALTGTLPNYGNVQAFLEGVTMQPTGQTSSLLVTVSQSGNSMIWLSGSLAAGNYHIRFNFRVSSGSGISSVTLHQGQLASGTTLATCAVTNSACDVILSWPGGSLSLLGVIGGSAWSYFSNITIAPTKL